MGILKTLTIMSPLSLFLISTACAVLPNNNGSNQVITTTKAIPKPVLAVVTTKATPSTPPKPTIYLFDSRANPHIINYNLTIKSGDSCTIREGVVMRFKANTGIIVYGSLNVTGDPMDQVYLGPAEDYKQWLGILILAHDSVVLKGLVVKGSTLGITVRNSSKIPLFDGVRAQYNNNGFTFEKMFTFDAPPYVIKNCHAIDSIENGFQILETFSNFVFEKCTSMGEQEKGFFINNAVSKIAIKNSLISYNRYGIYFNKSQTAFAFSNGSASLIIGNSHIHSNLEYGVYVYKVAQDELHHKSVDRLNVWISNSQISNHLSWTVYFEKCHPCTLRINGSTFMSNAGIIYSKGSFGSGIIVGDSTFQSNFAGGGVSLINVINPNEELIFENCLFTNNSQQFETTIYSLIDVLYSDALEAGKNYLLNNNTFEHNRAKYMIRIFEKNEDTNMLQKEKRTEIIGNYFLANDATSAIFVSERNAKIVNNSFDDPNIACELLTNEPRRPFVGDIINNQFVSMAAIENPRVVVCANTPDETITHPWEKYTDPSLKAIPPPITPIPPPPPAAVPPPPPPA